MSDSDDYRSCSDASFALFKSSDVMEQTERIMSVADISKSFTQV